MRQRRDLDLTLQVLDGCRAREPVLAVDVHRTGAANPFSARPAKGERWVDLVLDSNESIEDHWARSAEVERVSVETGVGRTVRIVTVDLERPQPLAFFRRVIAATPDLAVLGEREFSQNRISVSSLSPSGLAEDQD